jgi:hypothetical protein
MSEVIQKSIHKKINQIKIKKKEILTREKEADLRLFFHDTFINVIYFTFYFCFTSLFFANTRENRETIPAINIVVKFLFCLRTVTGVCY